MNFILRISPPFLRRLDTYLRVNHSWIWATKIHLHIYLGLLLGILFSFLGMLYGVKLTDVPSNNDQDLFFSFLFIPAAVFTIYMVWNMSLFNTDKSAAYRFKYQEFFTFLIYFFTFCLPLLIPFPASFILNHRIAHLENNRQFEIDKQDANEGFAFFPRFNDEDYSYYPSDSIYLLHTNEYLHEYSSEETDRISSNRIRHEEFWGKMKDSIFNNRGIYKEKRPKLYYIAGKMWDWESYSNEYYTDYSMNYNHENFRRDSLFTIYLNKINIERNPQVAKVHIARASNLVRKYYGVSEIDQERILYNYLHNCYRPGDDHSWNTEMRAIDISIENISNIHSAKNKSAEIWKDEIYSILFILILCMSIIFEIFKNVHWKQFLLAAAIFVAGLILIAFAEVSFQLRGSFFAGTGVWLPPALLIISFFGFSAKKQSPMLIQANIFLSLILAFYPIIVLFDLSEYHHFFHSSLFDNYKELHKNTDGTQEYVYNSDYYILLTRIRWGTFFGGILVYVFVWVSYLKALYLRYWSLPKNR